MRRKDSKMVVNKFRKKNFIKLRTGNRRKFLRVFPARIRNFSEYKNSDMYLSCKTGADKDLLKDLRPISGKRDFRSRGNQFRQERLCPLEDEDFKQFGVWSSEFSGEVLFRFQDERESCSSHASVSILAEAFQFHSAQNSTTVTFNCGRAFRGWTKWVNEWQRRNAK